MGHEAPWLSCLVVSNLTLTKTALLIWRRRKSCMIFLGCEYEQYASAISQNHRFAQDRLYLTHLGVNLVHAANTNGEQELLLWLDVEASLGLGLTLQADRLLLLYHIHKPWRQIAR